MDAGGSDVSLAIRRARRNNAKSLDLSRRGLRTWPAELFALRQLETLDVSGNELTAVDPNLTQLQALEELDLSGNKLESLPSHMVATLRSLRSLVLDGNPAFEGMPSSLLRQMARPSRKPGQTPVQVICSILPPERPERAPPPPPPMSSDSEVTPVEDGYVGREVPSPPRLPPPAAPAEDASQATRVRALIQEVERLQARIAELEEEKAASPTPIMAKTTGGGGSSKPSWLADSGRTSLAATLPSRRGLGGLDDDEDAGLKNQLKEEQRRSKRLEQQVQRLTDRLSEASGAGAVGSLPHFEMVEVQLGDILNQGGFSVVHKGTWHGTKVAVKKLFDPNISAELLAEFDNEVQKLELLRHPNILMALAVHRKPPALSLIMEMVDGGSYYQLLHAPHQFNSASGPVRALTFKENMSILDATATAMAFLHARGMAHRDIKSHNVLLSPHLEVKLCDFGLAKLKSELMTGSMQFAGTPNYMAPEVFRNAKYTESVDVFAFGTLLWEAMANDIPFANLDPADIRERVIEGQMLEMPSMAPREVQQLIRSCWTLDYKVRPTMPEVLQSLRACRDADKAPRRPVTAHGVRPGAGRLD